MTGHRHDDHDMTLTELAEHLYAGQRDVGEGGRRPQQGKCEHAE